MISKYVDHLPLHRQSRIFLWQDVDLSRSTLCAWVADVATALTPIGDQGARQSVGSSLRSHPLPGATRPDGLHRTLTKALLGRRGQHLWAHGYFCAVGAVAELTVMQYAESQKWDQDDEGFKVTAPTQP
jgi:hypothetical protein